MKSKLRIACAALLATAATQAMALQLGQIQVKSALNQPLVAAIPLHPKNLTELDGLTVALAPAADFARAGLKLTPTDQTLRFHVVTDNNGQKLILVTSSQPITDPYLDFLVQVNTRQGKQVREFVVLLNPVIAAPAPAVQAAPVASTAVQQAQPPQSAEPQPRQSLEFPPPLVKPSNKPAQSSASIPASKPESQAKPKPAAQAKPRQPAEAKSKPQAKPQPEAAAVHRQKADTGKTISVARGDTLYGIARHTAQGTDVTINQMMLALKAANPDAFFKNNINDLRAGAILRIPTRNQIDKTGVAEANAEVRRQYEAWRAAKPHPATVLAGSAAQAAARSAPQPAKSAPASDHLSLVPPSGKRGGANNRPGVAGGTGSETVADLGQQLQNERGALISLDQSNADLASRVQSLKKLSGKSAELLSLKDATIAELQQKLAKIQSGKAGAAAAASSTKVAASSAVAATSTGSTAAKPATNTSAPAHSRVANKSRASARKAAAHVSHAMAQPWYERPIAWAIAGLVILVLILAGLFTRKRRPKAPEPARGPLPDPEDVAGTADAVPARPGDAEGDEDALYARLAEHPDDLEAHLQLCRTCYARGDAAHFVLAAEAMHEEVADPDCAEWREVRVMGTALAPRHALFARHADGVAIDDPYGLTALRQPSGATDANDDATLVRAPVDDPVAPADEHEVPMAHDEPPAAHAVPVTASEVSEPPSIPTPPVADEPAFSDDPVDTKLDLARAYLDMGDPVGARAMLEEVIEEGSQTQKDEARRLLAEAGASD